MQIKPIDFQEWLLYAVASALGYEVSIEDEDAAGTIAELTEQVIKLQIERNSLIEHIDNLWTAIHESNCTLIDE